MAPTPTEQAIAAELNPFLQVLVHLDATPPAMSRLKVARDFGHAHGASVTALYAMTPTLIQVPFAPEAGAAAVNALSQIDDDLRNATH
ncbi:MAG: hypothetical protein ABI907_01415, partial [Ramlibacter sp.]